MGTRIGRKVCTRSRIARKVCTRSYMLFKLCKCSDLTQPLIKTGGIQLSCHTCATLWHIIYSSQILYNKVPHLCHNVPNFFFDTYTLSPLLLHLLYTVVQGRARHRPDLSSRILYTFSMPPVANINIVQVIFSFITLRITIVLCFLICVISRIAIDHGKFLLIDNHSHLVTMVRTSNSHVFLYFWCNECEETFATPDSLKSHKEFHVNEGHA